MMKMIMKRIFPLVILVILVVVLGFGESFGSLAVQAQSSAEQARMGAEGGGSANADDLGTAFKAAANILLYIVGALSVIMVIVGGLRYVVSGGDPNATAGAKNTIIYALIGIAVAFMAYAAVNFVISGIGAA